MGGTLWIDSRLSLRRKVVLKEHLSRSERQRWAALCRRRERWDVLARLLAV
jgi:hypothetical protein